jgi:hypothetical protein
MSAPSTAQTYVGDLYDLLHRSAVEAEATWSLLPDRGDGSRVFTVLNGCLPTSVLVLATILHASEFSLLRCLGAHQARSVCSLVRRLERKMLA